MKTNKPTILVTCEHGGNRIPAAYRDLFRGQSRLLESHRGWDKGAIVLARDLARALDAESVLATTSRLLVDLNRSPGHPARFSRFTRGLPMSERRAIERRYYEPYRSRVALLVGAAVPSLHLSVHSFTPVLDGATRNADLGLLYDPSRLRERRLCDRIARELSERASDLRVRRNYPYKGTADGLAQSLRRVLPPYAYIGVELELNQRLVGDAARFRKLRRAIVQAISAVIRGNV